VVATVTAACVEDPAWGFLMNDEYGRLAPRFAGALFDLRIDRGSVWVSDDLATVAMWDDRTGAEDRPERAERVWGATGQSLANRPTKGFLPTTLPSQLPSREIPTGT
jgi:hypothetical protein